MPEVPNNDLDVGTYPKGERWHFTIIKLMQGPAGYSSEVYRSESYNKEGYDSKEEAENAGIKKKQDM